MTRLALPIIRPVDGGGNPYRGGSLTFYEAGASTTPKPVFADSALSVSLGSKVNADGEGLFVDIYYDDDIRIVLKDKTGLIKNTKDIYGAGTIDTGDIANDAVTTPKIVNGAVTVGKIEVLGSAEIITSNGVANSKVPVSGDLTMNSGGAFAIGNEKITEAMLSPAIAADLSVSPLAKDGVKLSNGTDTDHDIDITAGKLTDSTSSVYIGFPAATISIDVTIGSGSGGFPSSGVTLSPETRYRVFICSKADGTDPLAAFDDSPSAVNARADMGTGSDYTLFRRIGCGSTEWGS